MADDDTPVEGSLADTVNITASTHTSASTPPPNTTLKNSDIIAKTPIDTVVNI